MNEFEQRLQRVPLKSPPPDWRAGILETAAAAASAVPKGESGWQRIHAGLNAMLWPHPKAWAGLAAVWVFILLLNFSQRSEPPGQAPQSAPPSPETLVELRQQQQLLVQLLGEPEMRVADRPKMTGPRTERTPIMRG